MEFLSRNDENYETVFKSAAKMPREAARTWIEITEVKCLRF